MRTVDSLTVVRTMDGAQQLMVGARSAEPGHVLKRARSKNPAHTESEHVRARSFRF